MHLTIIAIGLPLVLIGFIFTALYARRRKAYYNDFVSRRVNVVLVAEDQASAALRRAADSMADIRLRAPHTAR